MTIIQIIQNYLPIISIIIYRHLSSTIICNHPWPSLMISNSLQQFYRIPLLGSSGKSGKFQASTVCPSALAAPLSLGSAHGWSGRENLQETIGFPRENHDVPWFPVNVLVISCPIPGIVKKYWELWWAMAAMEMSMSQFKPLGWWRVRVCLARVIWLRGKEPWVPKSIKMSRLVSSQPIFGPSILFGGRKKHYFEWWQAARPVVSPGQGETSPPNPLAASLPCPVSVACHLRMCARDRYGQTADAP